MKLSTLSPSSAEIENEWNDTSTPPLRLRGVWTRRTAPSVGENENVVYEE